MAVTPRILSPDLLNRKVLFAVELVDPITRAFVYDGMTVRPAGLNNRPIVSRSGRFVWLEEGETWPGAISIEPERAPYAAHVAAAPPRPIDLETATPGERLVRVMLRPAVAYPFDDGVTVIRGQLRETGQPSSAPVVGARVQLAWADDQGQWRPAPPVAETVDEGASDAPSVGEQETDAHGEFVAFLHLQPPPNVQPDLDAHGLRVRLQITRGRTSLVTRATPDEFPFMSHSGEPDDTTRGRVREGRVLARDVTLGWSELTPI